MGIDKEEECDEEDEVKEEEMLWYDWLTDWNGAIRDSPPYYRTLLFHKRGKMYADSVFWDKIHKNTLKLGFSYAGHGPDLPLSGRSYFNHQLKSSGRRASW